MLELWQTIFSGLTLLVVATTASIALVQLGDLRRTNQMSNASTLLQGYWTPQFQGWLHFVFFELQERLKDPAYRDELRRVPVDKTHHPEIYVCEYYSLIGAYIKHGLMPTEIFLSNGSSDVVSAWRQLQLPIQLIREGDTQSLYRDFDALASLCEDWIARYRANES